MRLPVEFAGQIVNPFGLHCASKPMRLPMEKAVGRLLQTVDEIKMIRGNKNVQVFQKNVGRRRGGLQRSSAAVFRVFGRGAANGKAIRYSIPPQQVRPLQSLCRNSGFNNRPVVSSTTHFGPPGIQAVSHRPDPRRERQQCGLESQSLLSSGVTPPTPQRVPRRAGAP